MDTPRIGKYLVNVNIDDIKPYPGNPRRNNKSAKIVAESIARYGYINPIVVTDAFMILAGHTRLKALKMLNYQNVDVLVIKGLSEEQIHGFMIADNRVGEYSQWNYAQIDRMLTGQPDTFINKLGLTSAMDNKKALEDLITGNVNDE